jgi:hypothetical protein
MAWIRSLAPTGTPDGLCIDIKSVADAVLLSIVDPAEYRKAKGCHLCQEHIQSAPMIESAREVIVE